MSYRMEPEEYGERTDQMILDFNPKPRDDNLFTKKFDAMRFDAFLKQNPSFPFPGARNQPPPPTTKPNHGFSYAVHRSAYSKIWGVNNYYVATIEELKTHPEHRMYASELEEAAKKYFGTTEDIRFLKPLPERHIEVTDELPDL